MPSNFTENYQLNQWEAGDKVQRVDFNADNAKIDGAIKAVDTLARSKADTSALNALSQTVAGHTAVLALKSNCQIWTTTYTGTGKYGQSHPTTLTFPKKPLLAVIESGGGKPTFLLPRNGWMFNNESEWLNHLSWNGGTASWYIDSHSQADAYKQLNGEISYWVLAFLAADQ